MSENNSNNQSWLSTIPGTITAIATLITAIGGLIVILHNNGCFDNTKPAVNNTVINKDSMKSRAVSF